MRKLDHIVLSLLIFAGLNWGLWGLFDFNLVNYIFGRDWIDRLFYVMLGVCGLYLLIDWRGIKARAVKK